MASTGGHHDHVSMGGKVCLVTGATSGIGKETAIGLARRGATVLLVARDPARGAAAATELGECAPQATVELFVADLAHQHDVRELARQVAHRHQRLDVLVNNAAAVNSVRRVTAEGIEATVAVNHLAPFLLTNLLYDQLRSAQAARVVTVSSYLHNMVKVFPWDDLHSERSYRSHAAYNLTKLMNILFTYELARRCPGTRLTANALHPGWPVKTNLGREEQGMGAIFDRVTTFFGASAAKGARTSLFLASSPSVAGATGGYFAKCKPATSSRLSHDEITAQKLWQASSELCGISAGGSDR
jgi:retinol dehydrogenase 12